MKCIVGDNKILIIVGMHRSGTSLTANWLDTCGLNLGDRLLEANSSNPKGHFEDIDFHDLHEEIFRFNNISYGGILNIPNKLETSIYFKKKIEYNIFLKKSLRDQWGWKEPRTCLFLEHYRNFVPEAYYLILFRDCRSVVNSLIKRNIKQTREKFYKNWKTKLKYLIRKKYINSKINELSEEYKDCWIRYNSEVLKHINATNNNKYLVVNIEKLIDEDKRIFDHIRKWGFELKYKKIHDILDKRIINTGEKKCNDEEVLKIYEQLNSLSFS